MKQSIPETKFDNQSQSQEPQRNSIPVDSAQDPQRNNGNAVATPKGLGSKISKAKSVRTRKSVRWNPELVAETTFVASPEYSPRIFPSTPFSSTPSFSVKDTVDTVRDVLGRWGRKVGEATRKAECLAENTWVHLRTNPSFTEAAVGRIARGTKVLAEGGYENIFLQTFETVPGEQVLKAYACYISTSVGPVMGILYISTEKIAYCSDNPISYYQDDEETEWSYYKVIIPLHQLKAVIPSTNRLNPAEKYIQLTSNDNHEFWFMGFFNYDATMDSLKEVLQASKSQSAR